MTTPHNILQALNGTTTEVPDVDYDFAQYFYERLNNSNGTVSLHRPKVAGLVLAHKAALEELKALRHRMAGLEK